MNDAFSSVLDRPQLGHQPEGMITSQSMGLYDDQHFNHCQRNQRKQVLIRNSFVNLARNPYTQETPDETPRSSQCVLELQRFYHLAGDRSLIAEALIKVPTLYTLLRQAVEPLQQAFGRNTHLHLEGLESDDDIALRVMVKLPSNTPRPAQLMRTFKQSWWLKNCSLSQASLVFDYETSDAI